jgi:hypothetical protein
MADGQNITATPYPFYATGSDDGDDAFKATLISHQGASIERNQDSQFAAARSQLVHRDVQDGKRETVQAKFDAVVAQKDAEIRAVERHSELKAELAAMRAEGLSRELSALRADTGNEKLASVLARIATKLGA